MKIRLFLKACMPSPIVIQYDSSRDFCTGKYVRVDGN